MDITLHRIRALGTGAAVLAALVVFVVPVVRRITAMQESPDFVTPDLVPVDREALTEPA